ncbi:MAG: hypothetical protein PGN11_08440 [Quadrisphaera sp.]
MDVLAPALAAALHELDVLDPRQRPLLAAHWVAQGLGGPVLSQLAGLHGDEREVADLWPPALQELGVDAHLVRTRRTALPWVMSQLKTGERDLPWVLHVLWPTRADTDEDDDLDSIVYSIDTALDYIGALQERSDVRRRTHRGPHRDQEVVADLRARVAGAVEALERCDIDAAAAALDA